MKRIPKSVKYLPQTEFINLFNQFIRLSYKGFRTKKNGERLKPQTVDNYTYALKLLQDFSAKKEFELRLYLVNHLTMTEMSKARKYWQRFYIEFTDYLYDDLGHYDNYVGATIKQVKTFLNYVKSELMIDVGEFHKSFHVPKEEIQIVVLTPEQVNHLLNDVELDAVLTDELKLVRDLFVFGCTVALRYSDITSLKPLNLVYKYGSTYLKVKSKKTGADSLIKLPEHAIKIINKYKIKSRKTIFPSISKAYFNVQLKKFAVHFKQREVIKYRYRRRVPVPVYKNPTTRMHYALADHITTHTMRRTAITSMLQLGMPEQTVRKISGHAANSQEFYKYIAYNQAYLDQETDKVFERWTSMEAMSKNA